jgi:cytochrome c oxidase subunit 3
MAETPMLLHEPFEDRTRQLEANVFGMWLFLATEVLFFGGLFGFYAYIAAAHPAGLEAGARETNALFGTINTVLLLTSSLTMAIAERGLEAGLARAARVGLWLTLALGIGFLACKGLEYRDDTEMGLVPGEGFPISVMGAEPFWSFYWTATVVHAIHMSAGLLLIGRLLALDHAGRLKPHQLSVTVTTIYWHLVDCVWVILYALLYLPGR